MLVATYVSDALFFPTAITMGIVYLAAGMWHSRFQCPACRERFFQHKGFSNLFASKCMNCGCRIGATKWPE